MRVRTCIHVKEGESSPEVIGAHHVPQHDGARHFATCGRPIHKLEEFKLVEEAELRYEARGLLLRLPPGVHMERKNGKWTCLIPEDPPLGRLKIGARLLQWVMLPLVVVGLPVGILGACLTWPWMRLRRKPRALRAEIAAAERLLGESRGRVSAEHEQALEARIAFLRADAKRVAREMIGSA